MFDFDAKVKTVSSSSLTIVERDRAIPLNELDMVRILSVVVVHVVDCQTFFQSLFCFSK